MSSRRNRYSTSLVHLGVRASLWRRKRPDGTRHSHWSADIYIDGKVKRTSTREVEMGCAEKRVREIIEELVEGTAPRQRPGKAASMATLDDVIAAYTAGSTYASKQTVRTNVNALLALARCSFPDNAGAQPATILDRRLVEVAWMSKQGGRVLDRRTRSQLNVSLNSSYKHARDVFARRTFVEKFGHLRLPDLTGFTTVPLLPTPKQFWTPIPPDQYKAMTDASHVLKDEAPDLWRCYTLLSRLGLRNKELAALRSNWMIRHGQSWALVIEDRESEGFSQKGTRPRTLPLAPDLAELILSVGPNAYVILPHASKTERLALIERDHCQWLRQFIVGRVKANHELRKHVGSVVLSKLGLAAAQRYLGHASSQTTERWYATYLQDLPAITADDLRAF